MLTKPDIQTLRALSGLSRQAGWSDVDRYLTVELDAIHEAAMTAREDVVVRQLQGRAQFIREFQAHIRNAGGTLEKLRDNSLT